MTHNFFHLISRLPVYLIQFLTFFHPYYSRCRHSIPDWAYATCYFMQYANSAIDPLLYFWFSSHFRKELAAIGRRVVVCVSGGDNRRDQLER